MDFFVLLCVFVVVVAVPLGRGVSRRCSEHHRWAGEVLVLAILLVSAVCEAAGNYVNLLDLIFRQTIRFRRSHLER